jgi:hypothetical protein
MSAMVCCTQRRHAKKKAHSTNILQITYTLASAHERKRVKSSFMEIITATFINIRLLLLCLDTRHDDKTGGQHKAL